MVGVAGRGGVGMSADRNTSVRVQAGVDESEKGNVNTMPQQIVFTVAVTGRGRAPTSADRNPNIRVHPRVSASKKGNVNSIPQQFASALRHSSSDDTNAWVCAQADEVQ